MKKITWKDVWATVGNTPPQPYTREVANKSNPAPTPSKPKAAQPPVAPPQPPKVNAEPPKSETKENPPVRIATLPPTPSRPVPSPVQKAEDTVMNSDSIFVIGKNHDVCQDYVSNFTSGVKSYVVLADGCSGSSDSDIGARVLVKTYELHIPSVGVLDFNEYVRRKGTINQHIIEEAYSNAKSLELDPMALDATVLSIVSNRNGEFMATCYGDGVVALGRHDGSIETYSVSYKQSFPNYMSYLNSPERRAKFEELEDNIKEITIEIFEEGKPVERKKHRSSTPFDVYLGTKDKYRWVAVLSDGVHSFMHKVQTETAVTQEPVSASEVMKELFAFKSFQGAFVKRRMNRFLELCQERQWTHGDDLSVGVVYLGDK